MESRSNPSSDGRVGGVEPVSGSRSRKAFLRVGESVLRLAARLPLSWQLGIGRNLGTLLWATVKSRLKIARINLQLCFPELSDVEREGLLKRHIQALGMGLFDTAAAWFSSDRQLRDRFVLEGREHLDEALARGKGVLLLGAHFTTQELGVRMLSFHYDLNGVYRRHHDPAQEASVRAARLTRFADLIPSDDMRKALKYLKQGKIVWYPPDQDFGEYGMAHSSFVPFFGIEAATVTVPGRLAKKTGAALVPFFFVREAGCRYRLRILPAMDAVADDPVEVAKSFNTLLEQEIRKAPEQYLWVHQRFKTRPDPKQPSPYDDKLKK